MIDFKTKNVCDINTIMKIRFLFGFYCDFPFNKRFQNILKFYCISVLVVLILGSWVCSTGFRSDKKIVIYCEYIAYFLISLSTKDRYIFDYYKQQPLIDGSTTSKVLYKKLERLLKYFVTITIVLKMLNIFVFCGWNLTKCINELDGVLFINLLWIGLLLARLSLPVIYGLLYFRLRVLRMTLESKGFSNSPQNRFTPKKYITIYEKIMEDLFKMDYPLKYVFIIFLIGSVPKLLQNSWQFLNSLKNYGPEISKILEFTLECLHSYIVIILPIVVALDLSEDEIKKMKIITLNKRLACLNERQKMEIQQLFLLLKNNSLRYNLWRVVPVNLKSVLIFLSFGVTNAIAIMQAKNLN
ncbi:uncharacterized protein LOC114239849 [Bombyx mandarina]|uniref:Uncharacterized protein LOC114239849 n=1 Tax=Bombyx mandarina TaxID=7092 RepID=A0A6J2J9U9_BOMMA|nr:uncharacterized protein LOC114239849 [Bombyx mandarina]